MTVREEHELIVVNKVAVDWITLTSWIKRHFDYWQDRYTVLEDWLENMSGYEQYKGPIKKDVYGSVFVGNGKQKGRDHFLLYVTGNKSDREMVHLHSSWDNVRPSCSRIDLQATVYRPDNWNQVDLFTRLERTWGLKCQTYSDPKTGMRTVAVRVTDHDEYIRIYEKPSKAQDQDGNVYVFLRFEVQYRNKETGRGKAERVATDIWNDDSKKDAIWKFALSKIDDDALHKLFADVTDKNAEFAKVLPAGFRNTRKWLVTTVLKSLGRYLESNPTDRELMERYATLIGTYYIEGENDGVKNDGNGHD